MNEDLWMRAKERPELRRMRIELDEGKGKV
jgi:hypothetical protein